MSTAQTEVAAITTIDPDLQISATSVFRDDTWNFDVTLPGKQQNRIYWAVELGDGSLLTDPKNRKWLDAAKTFLYRYMQGEVSLDRELRTGTVINKAFNLRKLIWWMSERNLFSFSSLTEQHIISYRNSIRVRRARKRGQGGVTVIGEKNLSRAGAIANVGLKTCHGCSNFAVDPSHLPFWQQQLAAIENSIAEVRGLGMTSSALEQQRKDASEMVERLSGHGRP